MCSSECCNDGGALLSLITFFRSQSSIDIKDAYRIVPVHSDDWPMLGMQWKGQYFIDPCLPFGLRSAPKLFTALADAAQWLIQTRGVKCCLHYLDDYFFVEPPHMPTKPLAIAINTLAKLGIPLAPDKVEGPTTHLSFLGIELDAIAMTASLPTHKLQHLQDMLVTWHDRKACTKWELLSLVGVLQHATMVVRFGRALLRRSLQTPADALLCYLALQGLKWQTIKSYQSAVRHFQLMQGAPPGSLDEAWPRLQHA